jgi:hypothetical protein
MSLHYMPYISTVCIYIVHYFHRKVVIYGRNFERTAFMDVILAFMEIIRSLMEIIQSFTEIIRVFMEMILMVCTYVQNILVIYQRESYKLRLEVFFSKVSRT